MIMETWYLIEKQHLKQVKRFLKKLSKYLTRKDSGDWVILCIPKESMVQEFDEITTKKELYRLFNFYIPILKNASDKWSEVKYIYHLWFIYELI